MGDEYEKDKKAIREGIKLDDFKVQTLILYALEKKDNEILVEISKQYPKIVEKLISDTRKAKLEKDKRH